MKNRSRIVFSLAMIACCVVSFQDLLAQKKITVYTTAKNTDFRISKTEELELSAFGQPFETQPCVFVDPSHTFQTLVGIGGAITDASAETFAKLPANMKQEFITTTASFPSSFLNAVV